MRKKFQVYQIVDHPTLTRSLRRMCMLELNESDIDSISRLKDIGDCLYELTVDSIKRLSNSQQVAASILTVDSGTPYVIDLQEAFV